MCGIKIDGGSMDKFNLTEIFKWFHANPELGFKETETTKKIREILVINGIDIVETNLSTGLIAVIHGKKQGKTVCLRADIDALPIQEETGLDYASCNTNVMHACGHDFHTTVALGVAIRLNRIKNQFSGTVYIAFEPGEEAFDGAKHILGTGVLKHVSEFYGFHADPAMSIGEAGIKVGGVMAAVDRFRIDVKGIGTHAATPHLGNNPIVALSSLMSDLQSFAGREIPPSEPVVISFTHIDGGTAWNIIPNIAYLEGTVRTLSDEVRRTIRESFHRIVQGFKDITEAECELQWIRGASAVINSVSLCNMAENSAKEEGMKSVNFIPEMVSDDFSSFTELNEKAKGLYLKIGTGKGYPLHHPKFKVDPEAIDGAVSFISNILYKTLS